MPYKAQIENSISIKKKNIKYSPFTILWSLSKILVKK